MRLLLVDDHVLFREGLSSLLSAQPGIKIVGSAESVAEAIAMAQKLKPDTILMDFTLPDGTGLDATQAILASNPDTVIVFLTVHEDDERLFGAIRSGAKGFLPKNISLMKLVSYLHGAGQGDAAITPNMASRVMDELARTRPDEVNVSPATAKLTTRELEVLREIETGASNQEIADNLFISERTVKNHVSHILRKLNLRNRYQAADFARHNGLAGPTLNLK
jgi:DNA-binding NarL/FixJ family response regulator